jgi:hypothetical protein
MENRRVSLLPSVNPPCSPCVTPSATSGAKPSRRQQASLAALPPLLPRWRQAPHLKVAGGSCCATAAAPARKEAVVSSVMGSWGGSPRPWCCGGLLLSPRGGGSGVLESRSAGKVGRQIVVAARRIVVAARWIVVAARRRCGSGSGVVLREPAALQKGEGAHWSLWSALPGRSAGHQPSWARCWECNLQVVLPWWPASLLLVQCRSTPGRCFTAAGGCRSGGLGIAWRMRHARWLWSADLATSRRFVGWVW